MDQRLRFVPWFSRVVLFLATALFTVIAVRYVGNPIGTTAPFKISLGSVAAVTNMRVGFGAFPLGFAVVTLACLVSTRRHLAGLWFLVTIVAMVTAVRILGIVVDGPAEDSLKVLRPEVVLLLLSSAGLRLELGRRRGLQSEGRFAGS